MRTKAARAAAPDEARELAKLCARIADDKKGERVVILRMTELIGLLDYFVIASGGSRPQVQAIADEINETMRKLRVPCRSMEGYEDGRWVLLDCGDVVVHVFETMTREFYDLERLWADAPRVRWRRTTRGVGAATSEGSGS